MINTEVCEVTRRSMMGVSVRKCEEGIDWTENERDNTNMCVKKE